MTFQKLKKYTSWTIGSIVSDTGSEYLYGYDPTDGLMWLERSGVEYTPSDKVWKEAERFIQAGGAEPEVSMPATLDVSEQRPTVHRSVASSIDADMGTPIHGEVVGDIRPGRDVSDDDIASFAERFLNGEIELEEPDVEVR